MTSKRSYETSHPWLTFSIDLRQMSARFWLALGEIKSKAEHIAGVPLDPQVAEEFHNIFLAKGVLATTAIEGNTLSEDEVRRILSGDLKLPPSRQYLETEVKNIIRACNELVDQIDNNSMICCTTSAIQWMNRQILDRLTVEEGVEPGEIRQHSVTVGRYRGAPPEDCAYLLDRLCSWLAGPDFKPAAGEEVPYAVIAAIVAHIYLAWIHPFGDGNGRTARLVELQILLLNGLATPVCHLLSNHYNLTKTEYYRQLDHTSRSGGDIQQFMYYAIQGLVDGLREQVTKLRETQIDVSWNNYIFKRFQDLESLTDRRRRDLVLDLTEYGKPVQLKDLSRISERMRSHYGDKTGRTRARDLAALVDMDLVTRRGRYYTANKDAIQAFLPWRKAESTKPVGM